MESSPRWRFPWNGKAILVLAACLAFGCAKPAAIKNASSLQLQGILTARDVAARHQALADDVFNAASDIEREAVVARTAVRVVDQIAPAGAGGSRASAPTPAGSGAAVDCTRPVEDPSAAADCVARELFRLRSQQQEDDGTLTKSLQEMTRVYSRAAVAWLDLLYHGHALIHEYIVTDIGPSADQIQGIRSGLEALLKQDSQGGTQ